MKHLCRFKSFENVDNSKEEIAEYTQNYISKLSESELEEVKSELEKFAMDNNCSVDDLANPEFVKKILSSNIEEGIGTWIKDNWYKLCNYIGIGGKIAGIITFVGSIALHYMNGIDTITGVKVGVAAYIISSIVQSLRELEVLKEN
jgi:hypothetical protein